MFSKKKTNTNWIVLVLAFNLSIIQIQNAAAQNLTRFTELTINVKDFGAKGDGVTDDTKAINKAILSANKKAKNILFFPNGNYLISGSGILLDGEYIEMIGESNKKTIITGMNIPNAVSINTAGINDSLIIKNIRFDGSKVTSNIISIEGVKLKGSGLVENCFFFNGQMHDVFLNNVKNFTISNNIFRGLGDEVFCSGIYIYNGCNNINITHNKFLYIYNGVYVVGRVDNKAGSILVAENSNIKFINNYLDLGWDIIPTEYQTAKVNYNDTLVTDIHANFPKFSTTSYVQVLQPLCSGITRIDSLVIDINADFVKAGIKSKDLIKSGNLMAVIFKVINKTTLKTEGWINESDMSDVSPPQNKTHYSIYRIILGEIRNNNSNTVHVARFIDLWGNLIIPKSGWRFGILNRHPNYPFFASSNNSRFEIRNNVFKRGWSDQISVFGDSALISYNLIQDGQDMGITLHGKGHKVLNNTIEHEKTSGIWMECSNTVVEDNTLKDMRWGWPAYAKEQRGYIQLNGSNNNIENNGFLRNQLNQNKTVVGVLQKQTGALNNRIEPNKVVHTAE